jgi:hypothetical protein
LLRVRAATDEKTHPSHALRSGIDTHREWMRKAKTSLQKEKRKKKR